MNTKKRILLKLTGEIFTQSPKNPDALTAILNIIGQIKKLQTTHQFALVLGGGNFFRGSIQGTSLAMNATSAHQVGMLATLLNGLILKDICQQQNVETEILSAIPCAYIDSLITKSSIDNAIAHNKLILFVGGTGNPFFTTDTTSIVRGLQIQADQIWKGTNVDGIYDADPDKNTHAHKLKTVSYAQAIADNLSVMDLTAFTLAQQYKQTIKIFNIFSPDALIKAAQDSNFGSVIQ